MNSFPGRPLLSHCARFFISCTLIFGVIPFAYAQQSNDGQGLAPSAAAALAKAKVKSIVVFDFLGPGDTLSQLGADLADTFSHSLAKVAPDVNVIDRMQVRAVIEKNRVAPTVVRNSEISWWLAQELKAQSLIVGRLTPADGGKVHLAISIATVQNGKDIEDFSAEIPLSPEMKDHFGKTVWSTSRSRIPPPGTTIGKYPVCRHCPAPQYSRAAINKHQEGAVVLVAQIGLDGILRNIDFVKEVQYGLTQRAIVAVQSWKLDPAQDTKGKPIELVQTIEVIFHLTN